jgi:hypothetical protein
MKTLAIALLAVTFQFVPAVLHACDCGCGDDVAPPVHFKDGITPNGPAGVQAVYGDPSRYGDGCGCSTFYYRDYGAAHAPVPPPPVDTKEMKHPSS